MQKAGRSLYLKSPQVPPGRSENSDRHAETGEDAARQALAKRDRGAHRDSLRRIRVWRVLREPLLCRRPASDGPRWPGITRDVRLEPGTPVLLGEELGRPASPQSSLHIRPVRDELHGGGVDHRHALRMRRWRRPSTCGGRRPDLPEHDDAVHSAPAVVVHLTRFSARERAHRARIGVDAAKQRRRLWDGNVCRIPGNPDRDM
jgi:hypothetical protein